MTIKPADVDPISIKNMKKVNDGETVEFWHKGTFVAVGSGHKSAVIAELKEDHGSHGTMSISKGGILSKGEVYVHGCRDQASFKVGFARLSKK